MGLGTMGNRTTRRAGLVGVLVITVSTLSAGFLVERPAQAQLGLLRHLALRSSMPEADDTVGSNLAEVRLFFTEAPQMNGTTVRIANAREELVSSSEAAADAQDPTQVFVRPAGPLGPGTYTVHWRAIAQDGHAVNGDFGFQVATE